MIFWAPSQDKYLIFGVNFPQTNVHLFNDYFVSLSVGEDLGAFDF